MTQRNFYLALLLLISTPSFLALDAKSAPKVEDAVSYYSDDDDDLDIDFFDEKSVEDLLASIDETKSVDTSPTIKQKMKLALTYLKIKALNAKDLTETHLAENKSRYMAAISVTIALIALFYLAQKILTDDPAKKEQTKNKSSKK